MSIVQAIILGAVQGLTEFVPISSSGHLILVPWLAGWTDVFADPSVQQTFDVALHAGTFFAAVIYFRDEVRRLVYALCRIVGRRRAETFDEKLVLLLAIASVPAAVLGFFLEDLIAERLSQPWVAAITLAAFGFLMLAVDVRAANDRPFERLNTGDSVLVGLAQALALVPGTSRSGVTITAGIFRDLRREAAVRFSFLMSIPIIGGAGLFKGVQLLQEGFPAEIGAVQFAIGVVTSFVTGYLAIAWLLRFLRTGTLVPFVVYRVALAIVVLALIATGVRSATV